MSEWGTALSASGGGGSEWGAALKAGGSKPHAKPDSPLMHAVKAPLERGMAMGEWLANSPVANGANAVLNATSNFGVGAANQYLKNDTGNSPASAVTDIPGALAAGAHAAASPGQSLQTTHALEQKLGLPVANDKTANVPQRVGQAVEDFGVGTGADPASYVPGLDVVSIARRMVQLGRGVGAATRVGKPLAAAVKPAADAVSHFVNPGHDLRQIMTREGQNVVEGMQHAKESKADILREVEHQRVGPPAYLKPGHSSSDANAFHITPPKKMFVDGKTVADLQRHLEGDVPGYHSRIGQALATVAEHSPLRKVSDIRRDALFVLPFAHMKNLTVLSLLGAKNGANVVARGIGYTQQLAKTPEALAPRIAELNKIGGGISYHATGEAAADGGELYAQSWLHKVAGLGKLSEWSNQVLERYDTGLRLALMDELSHRGITGYNAGAEIRDVMGGGSPSEMVKLLRAMGGNFPAWGLGVVPKAMGKAARDQPSAVKAYARANADVSGDVTQPLGMGALDVGGPAEDAARLTEAPGAFLASPSRLGVPADLYRARQAYQKGPAAFAGYAGQQAASTLPFAGVAEQATNWPYPSSAPAIARVVAGVPGAYFTDSPVYKKRAAKLKSLGMTPREIADELRREGMSPDPASK